jgi:hypothetical protein
MSGNQELEFRVNKQYLKGIVKSQIKTQSSHQLLMRAQLPDIGGTAEVNR